MTSITLILGGARSGKSAYAEQVAEKNNHPKIYIATAEILDAEMAARVTIHQKRRKNGWETLEVPLTLAENIQNSAYKDSVILVDCLTLWLSNLMHHQLDITQQTQLLVEALKNTQAEVILVSNEVGQGIVPDNALARQFRDYAGILHQQIAAVADRVIFVTAGLPMLLKGK